MNCEKCQELLGDFLDDAMTDADRVSFNAHLEECLPCYNVHAELNSIVSFCREHRGEYDAPPNERALWLRIRNTVESEFAGASAQAVAQPAPLRENWVKHFWGRSWHLSFAQMVTAVAAIIIFASLATVLSLRGLKNSSEGTADINSTGSRSFAMAGPNSSSKDFGARDNVWQQQIKFLTEVVEQRKSHWNPQVRADFERNLHLLDQTVDESLQRLQQHPHDDVTEEMLNAALNDKMQLLKEFSDL
ncbi:MAG: anti-sigma factor [Acidobacteriota bacterium]|nr:anti-sigma factor [Acidobacteriota bacterium]